MNLLVKQSFAMVGDIVIELKENKALGKNLLISYVFNTAFVEYNMYINIEAGSSK